jgi:hypothetical protein
VVSEWGKLGAQSRSQPDKTGEIAAPRVMREALWGGHAARHRLVLWDFGFFNCKARFAVDSLYLEPAKISG